MMNFRTKMKVLNAITISIWLCALFAVTAKFINQPTFHYANVLDPKLPKAGKGAGVETH